MDYAELHSQVTTILAEGLTADAVADAICAAVGLTKPAPEPVDPLPADDPAVTGVPRDETTDSIDAATGTLTPEAIAARQKLADDQAAVDADEAKLATDEATLAADQAAADDTASAGSNDTVSVGSGDDTVSAPADDLLA